MFVRQPSRMMSPTDRRSSPEVTVEAFARSGKCSKDCSGSASINQHDCLTCTAYLVGVQRPSRIA
ncbi:hypothetical protein K437DRAFT_255742 [Tilletiaria anomala UBC 951]|uniref:Uncharacterized protein n=1 Tax=Tilletiaria anomala (strain ATCC 24038 / CBS 436.72 / UBC 951) TaxID=1037660 RepID=A0A066W5B1_TILAU|nr:uncharacterized protein K437DRAFT_255742 [Tilletiaria anomala UBC 951]KDN47733.1 hypothetical protein K437DRAFT_255742 [Tilletiaria anomala UBC 951]